MPSGSWLRIALTSRTTSLKYWSGSPLPVEFGGDGDKAVGDLGADFIDIVDAAQHLFDRLGDGLFDIGRIRPGQRDDHGDHRDREVRIDRARDGEQRGQAQRSQQQERHQAELPAADGEGGKVHAGAARGQTAAAAGAGAAGVARVRLGWRVASGLTLRTIDQQADARSRRCVRPPSPRR